MVIMENIDDNFEIYLGTSVGSLINFTTNKKEQKSFHLRNEEKCTITSLCWGRNQTELLIGYKNGKLKIYDSLQTNSINIESGENSSIVGVLPFNDQDIYLATNSGNVYRLHNDKIETYLKNEDTNKTIESMVVNPYKLNVMGIGGVNNDIKLYDIETKKILFQGKSDRHDELELQQRISINSLAHLRTESGMDLATVTRQGQIRIYDTRKQRRPIKIFKNTDLVFTSVTATNKDHEIVVGSTKGYIQHFDLRTKIQPFKTFKGLMGGISDLVGSAERPIVACCSLDRYFRLVNLQEKKLEYQEYIKIQPTRIIMRLISSPTKSNDSDEDYLKDVSDEMAENTTKRSQSQSSKVTKKIKSNR